MSRTMDPFVSLMRRYCIDYTNSHDLRVCDEIMDPDYVVHIAGMSLGRDIAYKPAVEMVFARFPGLCLAIHEIMTNGERLAMRFTEHGADAESNRLACWAGIALYRWNGVRLTECRVEQDFLSQRRQLETGRPDALEPPHADPWTTTRAVVADAGAESAVREWLGSGDLGRAASGRIDDTDLRKFTPVVDPSAVEIQDIFSAGSRVAFHATVRGPYRTGLPGADAHRGEMLEVLFAGIASVESSKIVEARIVTDRLGAASRLTGQPMF